MGRLKQIPARLSPAPQRLGQASPRTEAERSRFRDRTQAWRAWYKTYRWQRLRWSVLVRDLFTCAMCGRIEGDTSQLVADHIVPHKGDEAAFWDEGNIWCVCSACHNSAKQRLERSGRVD